MIKEKVFDAAFPLHDGDFKSDPNEQTQMKNPRARLYDSWAQYSLWYKHQPLDQIKDYFGEKIAMYFAWLGAYTTALIFPTLIGILVFIFNVDLVTKDVTT